MSIKSAPGVFDILPNDPKEPWRASHLWDWVESILRQTSKAYGYQEIRTPIFERTDLFARSVGEQTDIVSKEMYTFEDRGGRSLSLRPEGTAPTIRAYVEHNLQHGSSLQKLFYIGPMFRYERMQAGRYRQFHQYGAEAIGNLSPEQDAEMIDLSYTLYQKLGLKDLSIEVSTLGTLESRQKFRQALQNYLRPSLETLSEASRTRFESNPLRILDSKDPNDKKALLGAPSILDFLDSESQDHFTSVLQLLDQLQIPYVINKDIVRGLDYYNKTVFEIISGELGAQNSVGGGGRYDTLVSQLGGKDTPAIGFATGIERILQVLLKQGARLPSPFAPTLYLIPLGEESKKACFSLLKSLRKNDVWADMDLTGKKLGKAMQCANDLGALYTAVVGERELETKMIVLKEMQTGETTQIPLGSLLRILQIATRQQNYFDTFQQISTPFNDPSEADFFVKKIGGSITQTTSLLQKLTQALEQIREII